MRRVIVKRLAFAVPLTLLASFLSFVLVALSPGDPAVTILGEGATPEQYAALRSQLGLDRPLVIQYGDWLWHVLQGDLGRSIITKEPVLSGILGRATPTMSVIVGTTIVSALIGVAMGIHSGVHGGVSGRVVDMLSLVGFAVPHYWVGPALVVVFALGMPLLPATGYTLAGLVLPVATLAISGAAAIAKQTRDSMRATMQGEYVRALRARGLPERRIVYRHALRNASVPVVTVVGLLVVQLLSGTVIVESIFAIPGLGGLAVASTQQHDLPMIQGVVFAFTMVVVVVNLGVDLLYLVLNPRARVA
ncbi:ABC transporter permease [Microtetraspora fusca]|uniref:ABC transporter permease n=1 Tax=Microtetraspora fusca TaxID=1997 RepID=A0ABW6VJY9_MICFU|nr:ABC transporter permease [Microtetraspora fusca]